MGSKLPIALVPPDDSDGEATPITTSPNKLNEFNHAEDPDRQLLELLGWAYVPRESLADERGDERAVLLKSRLTRALLRLNEWLTVSSPGG